MPRIQSPEGESDVSRVLLPGAPNEENFREWFAVAKESPSGASPSWHRKRGLHFERALYYLLASEGLMPRTSFRPKSEEIDGAFELAHRYFLLEAKWEAKPVRLKELDALYGKVERKLSGTLGVFISMSGYSRGAVDSHLKSKPLKIVLFGERDMDACFETNVGFKIVLTAKLRAASEYGVPYLEYRPLVVPPMDTHIDKKGAEER